MLMRINKQKITRRNIIIIALAILIVLVAGGAAWALTGGFQEGDSKKETPKPENTVDYSEATDAQKEAGSRAKEDFINKQDEAIAQPSQSPSANTPLTITSVVQRDDTLQIRIIVDTATPGGACRMKLSREGSTSIIQTADTQQMGTYNVCKGFDIPVSGLEKGQWTVSIDYVNGESKGVAEKKVDIT